MKAMRKLCNEINAIRCLFLLFVSVVACIASLISPSYRYFWYMQFGYYVDFYTVTNYHLGLALLCLSMLLCLIHSMRVARTENLISFRHNCAGDVAIHLRMGANLELRGAEGDSDKIYKIFRKLLRELPSLLEEIHATQTKRYPGKYLKLHLFSHFMADQKNGTEKDVCESLKSRVLRLCPDLIADVNTQCRKAPLINWLSTKLIFLRGAASDNKFRGFEGGCILTIPRVSDPGLIKVKQRQIGFRAPWNSHKELISKNYLSCVGVAGVDKVSGAAFLCHFDLPWTPCAIEDLTRKIEDHGLMPEQFEVSMYSGLNYWWRFGISIAAGSAGYGMLGTLGGMCIFLLFQGAYLGTFLVSRWKLCRKGFKRPIRYWSNGCAEQKITISGHPSLAVLTEEGKDILYEDDSSWLSRAVIAKGSD